MTVIPVAKTGLRLPAYTARPGFQRAVAIAVALAVLWWLAVVVFGVWTGVAPWSDQRRTFTQAVHHLADPYSALVWPYVPWAVIPLIPFGLLPVWLAVLLQMILYFGLLAALVFRFEGGLAAVLIVLTSAIAFDTALEINLEWMVVIGLLVPPVWSGPLLLVKPQAALGAWLGFAPRDWLRGGLVVLAVVAAALLIWPGWVGGMIADIQANTLGDWGARINIAFSNLMPRPLSWGIGVALAILALRRRDPVIGVFAWQFVVPYATFYGIMPVFALFASRWPRLALIVSLTLWALYGSVLIPFLLAGPGR